MRKCRFTEEQIIKMLKEHAAGLSAGDLCRKDEARDDRPWSGADPPAAVYFYSPDRRAERPASHLAKFKGIVQVDGYPGFDQLREGGDIQLAACWAHARRKFYEVQQATDSPIAAEALRRIVKLYAIKAVQGRRRDGTSEEFA